MKFLRNRKERKKEKRRLIIQNRWILKIGELPIEVFDYILEYVRDYHLFVNHRKFVINVILEKSFFYTDRINEKVCAGLGYIREGFYSVPQITKSRFKRVTPYQYGTELFYLILKLIN